MFKTSSATFSVAVTGEDVAPLSLYRVIDVSAGSVATRYPVVYRNDVPMGGWGDEYKTDKIVLRRIDKPSGAYYAGIFEITEAQWDRVMGWSSTSTKPKGSVSYSAIRGNAGAYDWPNSDAVDPTSFVGRLRRKTGLSALDQPSEAEWEYAARADVTTRWPCGDAETGPGDCLGDYAWYKANSGAETHPVGTRRANAWGLYDVHGHVWEWGLERRSSDDGRRVLRGGCCVCDASGCALSYRNSYDPSYGWSFYGFRLFCRPESESSGSASGAFFSDTSAKMPLDLMASPTVLKVGETVEYSPLFSSEPCDTVCLNEVGGGVTNRLCESSMAGAFVWSSRTAGIHSLELVFLKDGNEVGARRTGSVEVWDESVVLDRVDVPLRQLLPTTYGLVSHVTLADGVTAVTGGFFVGCTILSRWQFRTAWRALASPRLGGARKSRASCLGRCRSPWN